METSTKSLFESSVDNVYLVFGQLQQSISLPKTESGHFCPSCAGKDKTNWQCLDCVASQNLLPRNNSINIGDEPSTKKRSWTKRQWLILFLCFLANFGCAVCQSQQAPFFPAAAAAKNVSSSIYGFVFGAFSLVVFILAPIFGIFIGRIGPKFLMNAGMFLTSICCILFGLLGKIESGSTFVTLAFVVRSIEAIGDAAFNTAIYTFMSQTFPHDLESVYALLRSSFGAGLILGPAVGGVLYQVGGFSLPFSVMGSFLFFVAIIMAILLRNHADDKNNGERLSILKALRIPSVFLAMTSICFGALSIGFLATTLEPHFRQFSLTPVQVSFMFVVSGGMYAVTTLMWGKLLNGLINPKIAIFVGTLCVITTYIFVGPAPFFTFNTTIWMCIVGLAFHGVGVGGQLLGSHIEALNHCTKEGFPKGFETDGMIAGMWASSFQLGNFIGPSIGGVLLESVGFRMASLPLLILQICLACATVACYVIIDKRQVQEQVSDENTRLVPAVNEQA